MVNLKRGRKETPYVSKQSFKKGISHVEMILSFLIFISAVGFALYFFSPADSNRLVESTLTYSIREIGNNVSVKMDIVSVKINSLANPTQVIAINISGLSEAVNVRAENSGSLVLNAMKEGEIVYVDSGGSWSDEIITLVLSDEIVDDSVQVSIVNYSFYQISSSTHEAVISEKRLSKLKDEYAVNYIGLKDDFNLPDRVDFGFSLVFKGSEISSEREVPDNFEVFSEKRRVKVLREDGSREFADLIVRVW